jgi:hypothetical protein
MPALTVAQTHIILLAASVPLALSFAVGSNSLKMAMIQIAREQTAEFIITKEALKMSNKYANMVTNQ